MIEPSSLAVFFDLIVVAVCSLLTRSGYYELFVDVPRVHTARWPDPWSMPKSALTIMLVAAIVGIVAAMLLIVAVRNPDMRRVARIVEVGALVTAVGAWLAWIADFLGSAGRFG